MGLRPIQTTLAKIQNLQSKIKRDLRSWTISRKRSP